MYFKPKIVAARIIIGITALAILSAMPTLYVIYVMDAVENTSLTFNLIVGAKPIMTIFFFISFSLLVIGTAFLGWQKKIKVKHNESGIQKNCFVGYSWTYFFFGFFVPVFRGEISIGVFHLILSMITFGIFQMIMPFLYNKQFSIRLLNNSWSLNDSEENNTIARQKIGIATD